MPLLMNDSYSPPPWFPGGDLQTIGPRLFCPAPPLRGDLRERFELTDGDFIWVDWNFSSGKSQKRSSSLVILSHGLEGDSKRTYMRSMALAFLNRGWDVAGRNFRGCGGGTNRLPKVYHSGEINDLEELILASTVLGYKKISLVGFSMGGNQVLKYLGERRKSLPPEICRSAAVSVPCDLSASSRILAKGRNRIYMEYFLRTLRKKMCEKHAAYPDLFPIANIASIKNFKEFDDRFTAPLNGFKNAEDYWEKASSLPELEHITNPVLIVNALNDPFLSPSCYPLEQAQKNPHLFLLTPKQGGHVAFPSGLRGNSGWLERTVVDFIEN